MECRLERPVIGQGLQRGPAGGGDDVLLVAIVPDIGCKYRKKC